MESQRKARLMNCLQTILEMESQLRSLRESSSLLNELSSLRVLVDDLKLEQVQLDEKEIQRIEIATMFFLRELEVHFQSVREKSLPHGLLQ
jgi:hypothetical protein